MKISRHCICLIWVTPLLFAMMIVDFICAKKVRKEVGVELYSR